MAAMTVSELVEYFNEHVYYEMLMLRCSKQYLEGGCTQLGWNVMFAAFNVSARNLYEFLTNDDDRRNVRILDYKPYRNSDFVVPPEKVTGTLGMMNAQCFHLGKTRSKEADRKIQLPRIRGMSEWILSNMDNLLKSFTPDFRAKLRPDWSDLANREKTISISGQTNLLASSLMEILNSGPTCAPKAQIYEILSRS